MNDAIWKKAKRAGEDSYTFSTGEFGKMCLDYKVNKNKASLKRNQQVPGAGSEVQLTCVPEDENAFDECENIEHVSVSPLNYRYHSNR